MTQKFVKLKTKIQYFLIFNRCQVYILKDQIDRT